MAERDYALEMWRLLDPDSEVYVCTMAERDYALEMWRLLDPDSNLITVKELLNRIVCAKSGLKKSLFNVFQDGNCHPKMALVIDNHLKVWDERDQPRVHVQLWNKH